jgi:hypothetical protein
LACCIAAALFVAAATFVAGAVFIVAWHSLRVPSQPQPQPFFSAGAAVDGAADCGAAVSPLPPSLAVRIRSVDWIAFLPLVDIAWRRASEACLATETLLAVGAAAIVVYCARATGAETGAGAAV